MTDRHRRFISMLEEIQHLHGAMAVLGWDQEVIMPTGAAANRAAQRSTLAGLIHERVVATELGDLMAELADEPDLPVNLAANLRVFGRLRDRALKLPERLVKELAEAVGLAQPQWVAARKDDDWSRFAPHLERIVALKQEEAAALALGDEPYDSLLDEFEPGARVAQLLPVFRDLRTRLADLLGKIDTSAWPRLPAGPYATDAQTRLSRDVLTAMGYDFDHGRLDISTHPFTESLGQDDVRVTSRFDEADLLTGLSSTMHEGGHALYEQGLPRELAHTPAGQSVSLGIHESQSRLWENHVGRSLAFCRWLTPHLREVFPEQLGDLEAGVLNRAGNHVAPTAIRVDSDEVTYNLHIVLRLELERALFNGELAVADVPAAWREQTRELLGLDIADAGRGPLQDIHWCMGALGYFPTYTLGNLYAAMFWNAAREDLPQLDQQIARGEFAPLTDWLRRKVHRRASMVTATELCREITGRELCADDFLAYLAAKFDVAS